MSTQRRTVADVEKEYQGQIAALKNELAEARKAGGGLCPSCAEKKAAEDALAAAQAAENERLGKLAVAKRDRLKTLELREKNRAGRDPYTLDEESQKLEDKYNAELRKLNVAIQGVDPLT